VEVAIDFPGGRSERVFEFGGDDERVRAFATGAGLHMIRIALQTENRVD
jgi:hypothetical protein